MSHDQTAVRAVLDQVRADGRSALTVQEGKRVCEAYGIPTPAEGLATSVDEAGALAEPTFSTRRTPVALTRD